ncbi:2-amino-3-carboxymuconate-6-semialdehyde decarboxylase [Hondaea fermentalgiana]|uniref:2-amino-3-carboxymuconate-6-semialdehyde decarboxylase n=1 Tax=Hondaea fermentalgiana TaxID=2315210 RepID=A0A2R5G909_9STRA|nr:2-amino-3-carboxymuconate-6-semialdehyde decarboxylase [Hondaea fermentalgiana]|eukprot:GBG27542.1 2-amino-3-carboxymuconate-6-semialdehyde decarboxylase [Hondaea fermentalgiana]
MTDAGAQASPAGQRSSSSSSSAADASKGVKESGKTRIDFHTHIVPRTWPDPSRRYGYGGFFNIDHDPAEVETAGNARLLKDSEPYLELGPNCWDVDARLVDMDAAGIDVQVLSTIPEMFSYWAKPEDTADLARILNNDMAEQIGKHPNRFVGLCTVPLQAPDLAITELTRCVKELGFAGAIVGTYVNEWNLDAQELIPFWEAAEDLGAVVFIHPNNLDTKRASDDLLVPRIVAMPAELCHSVTCFLTGGLLENFPKLKVCFANGGGTFPYVRGQIEQELSCSSSDVLLDAAARMACMLEPGRFAVDSIVHSRDATEFLFKTMSSDSVVFGSDYPAPLGGLTGRRSNDKYPVDPLTAYDYLEQATLVAMLCDNPANILQESLPATTTATEESAALTKEDEVDDVEVDGDSDKSATEVASER